MGFIGKICCYITAFVVLGYLVPHFIVSFLPKQDLKKKYNAKWAVVTGASSGIGKSLAQKLALQGINVVLVALDEPLLENTFRELKSAFKGVEFRKIGVNLGKAGEYLPAIAKGTEDIDVALVFNNAGYIVTGFFDRVPLERHLANVECNAVAGVNITHLFVTRMLEKKLKGAVCFTSSAAACQPCPFSTMYGATKASNFYKNAHALDAFKFFKQFEVGPDDLPDLIFSSIGRSARDIGGVALSFRMMMKLVDFNLMTLITQRAAPFMADFKNYINEPAKTK